MRDKPAPGVDRVRPAGRRRRRNSSAWRGSRGDPDNAGPDPAAFWRVKGARDLTPAQAAILQALFAYREQQAERLDRPPFKVMGEATLMELARRAPRRRRGPAERARHDAGADPPLRARRVARDPAGTPRSGPARRLRPIASPTTCAIGTTACTPGARDRARARGVESDVILPRTALWDLASRPPRTLASSRYIADFGPWRRETYGQRFSRCSVEGRSISMRTHDRHHRRRRQVVSRTARGTGTQAGAERPRCASRFPDARRATSSRPDAAPPTSRAACPGTRGPALPDERAEETARRDQGRVKVR